MSNSSGNNTNISKQQKSPQQHQEKLRFTTKLAYGAGDMGPAITANVLVFFLLPFFTNIAGLPAGLAGSILLIGKISDAINDPIVGVMSDKTRSSWGRRIPWMLFGAIPFGLMFFLQWIVPEFSVNKDLNNWLLFAYYIIIGILFNVFYTTVNLPYQALTPELTQDYNERTNLNSFRFAFSIGGSILSLVLAGIIFNAYPDEPMKKYIVLGLICSIISVLPILWCAIRIQERGTNPLFNYAQKRITGIGSIIVGSLLGLFGIIQLIFGSSIGNNSRENSLFGVIAILIFLLLVAAGISLIFSQPEPHLIDNNAIQKKNDANTVEAIPFLEQLKIVFNNKAFLYVIGIYLCSWLAVQLTASILLFFVVNWIGLSEEAFPTVAIAVQGTALIMLFFWKIVSAKYGKKIVFFIGTTIWLIAQIGLFLLQPGDTILLYFLAVLAGIGVSVAYLIPWSMVPDVIELDELQTGQRREGIFYGFMVLLQKFGLALGLFLVGAALEASGFIESIPGQPIPTQPDNALLAIRIAIAPLPAIILIIGLVLAYFYPITQEVHQEIMLKLQENRTKNHQN